MRDDVSSSHAPRAVLLGCLLAAALPGAAAGLAASLAGRANPSSRPPLIAPEVFARPAAYTGMRLSPLGRQAVPRSIVDGKAGKVHEFHVYEGEGHGLADPANFADWLPRLEASLRRHNSAD